MKNLKIVLSVFLVVVIALASYFIYGKVRGEQPFQSKITEKVQEIRANDKVVAKVNDTPIYLSDVARQYYSARYAYEIQKTYVSKDMANMLTEPDPMDLLNTNIDNMLLSQYAKEKGYKPDANYLDELIKSQKESFFNLLNGTPDPNATPDSKVLFEEFSKLLNDEVNESGLSPEDYFNKRVVPTLEDSATIYSMLNDLANINAQSQSPSEISAARKTIKENLIKELRGKAKIEIINSESINNLKTQKP
jgi:hypothetical protein